MRSNSNAVAKSVVRWFYLPILLLGVGGAVISASALGRPLLIVPVLVFAVGLSFAAERILPYETLWNLPRGDRNRDLAHALVNEGATAVTLASLPALYTFVPQFRAWPESLPFVVQVLLGLIVLDAGITLVHWLSHRWNSLWRFHAVHHSVRRLYGFNGLLKHPVHQTVETGVGMLPLLLVGVSTDVAAALAGLVVVQLLLQHSNCAYGTGRLGRWLALNSGHRLHHVARVPDGDVNFGLFLLVWDRMLGTYRDPFRYTVTEDEVGLAGQRTYPSTYFGQLVEPFKRRQARAVSAGHLSTAPH